MHANSIQEKDSPIGAKKANSRTASTITSVSSTIRYGTTSPVRLLMGALFPFATLMNSSRTVW